MAHVHTVSYEHSGDKERENETYLLISNYCIFVLMDKECETNRYRNTCYIEYFISKLHVYTGNECTKIEMVSKLGRMKLISVDLSVFFINVTAILEITQSF